MSSAECNPDAIINAFYDAALEPEIWPKALAVLAQILSAQGAVLLVGEVRDPGLMISYNYGIPREATITYNAYFHDADPLERLARPQAAGFFVNDWRDLGGAAYGRSAWYNDFMRPHELQAALGVNLVKDGSLLAAMAAQRFKGAQAFGPSEQAMLSRLLPHLQRALRIYLRLNQLGVQAALAGNALDRVDAPLMVVESDGRLRLFNSAADRMLKRNKLLTRRRDFLVATVQSTDWQQALSAATCYDSVHRATGLHLRDPAGVRDLQVLVTPIAATALAALPWQRPLAFVAVHQEGGLRANVEWLLQNFYGLSITEAKVARYVADGVAPKELADMNQVAESTVRSQIKTIYNKTDLHRQTDLTRLVTSMALLSGSASDEVAGA